MALCVSPPPHGFSQARCSSNSVTLKPAPASRSAQIEPEGPPPTMAISRMRTYHPVADPLSRMDARLASSQREHSRQKPGGQYSTKDGGCRRGAGAPADGIHPEPLKNRNERQEDGEKNDEQLSAVKQKEREHKDSSRQGSQRRDQKIARPHAFSPRRANRNFLRREVRKARKRQRDKSRPARGVHPGVIEPPVEPRTCAKKQRERKYSSDEQGCPI